MFISYIASTQGLTSSSKNPNIVLVWVEKEIPWFVEPRNSSVHLRGKTAHLPENDGVLRAAQGTALPSRESLFFEVLR